MKLTDFGPLKISEAKLVSHIKKSSRDPLDLSYEYYLLTPKGGSEIRADFLRAIILGRIEDLPESKEEIKIYGAIIIGKLDLSMASIGKQIFFIKTTFTDVVELYGSECKGIYITKSRLLRGLKADGLNVNGDMNLYDNVYKGSVSLRGSSISGILNCNGSFFDCYEGSLSADSMRVSGNANISNVSSIGELYLLGSKIGGDLNLRNTRTGKLSADRAEISGNAFFDNFESDDGVRLNGSVIGGDLSFIGSTLRASFNKHWNSPNFSLSCNGAKIGGGWFWREGASSTGPIDLTGATIGVICDQDSSWPSEILLDRCTYSAFVGDFAPTDAMSRISWLSRMNPRKYGHDFWPQPYEECARVLRASGDEAGAKEILIEKERLQQIVDHKKISEKLRSSSRLYVKASRRAQALYKVTIGKSIRFINVQVTSSEAYVKFDLIIGLLLQLLSRFARWLIGYGHKPLRATIPLFSLMLIGGIIFLLVNAAGGMRPNHPDVLFSSAWIDCEIKVKSNNKESLSITDRSQLSCFMEKPEGRNYPGFNALAYSVDSLLPIISLDVQPYWAPDSRSVSGKIGEYYLWAHIVLGWALTLLAVAGFSGLVKTGGSSNM